MDQLPNCVLAEIFIRLGARQLAQMRCVCNPWNALLTDFSFVRGHFNHSIQNNDEILLVFTLAFSFLNEPFKLRPCRSPDLELPNFIKLPINPQFTNQDGEVIGSVHGLICFKYQVGCFPDVIYIWNPSLSALLTLPPSKMRSSCPYFRFGFDPINDDYKVVKVAGIPDEDTDDIEEWLEVEVYSMRKGIWELITHKIPTHLTEIFDQDDVCVDGHTGHLHWLATVDTSKISSQRKLAYDLDAQTFREMFLPDSLLDDTVGEIYNILGVFNEKLCVMSSFREIGSEKFEVWVMMEDGVAESWDKLFVYSPFAIILVGFISPTELIFKHDSYVLYDAIAAKGRSFKFRDEDKQIHKIARYVDSLVWVSSATCCSISQFQF